MNIPWFCRPEILLLLVPLQVAAVSCPPGLHPFEHRYELSHNGKPLGQVELRLTKQQNDWLLQSETQADRGLAGLVGATLSEWVRFRCEAGQYQPLESRYERKLLFSKRKTHLVYDWKQKRVTGTHRGKPVDMALQPGMVDRLGIQLLLAADHAAGKVLDYRVQDRNKQRRWHFVPSTAPISGPGTAFKREDDNKKRETWFWLSADRAPIPLQIWHREEDDQYLSTLLN